MGSRPSEPESSVFHLTALGRQALALRSRDPANPDGYLAHLRARAAVGPVTDSYITEPLNTFNAACFKATAVMVGAAAESLALGVRDALIARLQVLGKSVPPALSDWRVKRVLASLETMITTQKPALREGETALGRRQPGSFRPPLSTGRSEAPLASRTARTP